VLAWRRSSGRSGRWGALISHDADADLTKGLERDHLDALTAFGDALGEAFSTRKS
jgi:hypothetical protein